MNIIVNFILGLVLGKITCCIVAVLLFAVIISYFATAMGIDIPYMAEFTKYVASLYEPIKEFIAQFIR